VTHGGAWIIFPLVFALVLSIPILLLWVYKGSGNYKRRKLIGFTQIIILVISIALFFTSIGLLQAIGLITCFVISISMLISPIVFKRLVS